MNTLPIRSLVLLSLWASACAVEPVAPGAPETAEGEEGIISFPASAYANAVSVRYGATTSLPFRAADGFVAVKFQAAAGDLLRVTVGAARATRSYLVLSKRNQTTLRDPNDAPGVYRFRITQSGEYFVMVRSEDRRDLATTVLLENLLQPAAGSFYSGAELLARANVAEFPGFDAVQDETKAQLRELTLRTCVRATGCGAAQRKIQVVAARSEPGARSAPTSGAGDWRMPLPTDTNGPSFVPKFAVLPDGKVAMDVIASGVIPRGTGLLGSVPTAAVHEELLRYHLEARSASADFADLNNWASERYRVLPETEPTFERDVRLVYSDPEESASSNRPVFKSGVFHMTGELGKSRLRLSFVAGGGNGADISWTQIDGALEVPLVLPNVQPRPVSEVPAPRPQAVDRRVLDDEEVISRFASGSTILSVLDDAGFNPARDLLNGYAGGRSCGPRTGCTAAGEGVYGLFAYSSGSQTSTMPRVSLVINDADSYSVRLDNILMLRRSDYQRVPTSFVVRISDGVGTLEIPPGFYWQGPTTLRVEVTPTGLSFIGAYERKRVPGGGSCDSCSETTKVRSVPGTSGWFEVQEPGYFSDEWSDMTSQIRFNKNWN